MHRERHRRSLAVKAVAPAPIVRFLRLYSADPARHNLLVAGFDRSGNIRTRNHEKHRLADGYDVRPRADALAPFAGPDPATAPTAEGEKGNNNQRKDMEITREQREGFMRLLQEAKNRKQVEYQRDLDKKVKEELLPKIMQRQGIVRLVEQVKNIGHQLSESAQKLQGMDVFGQPATLWGKILGTNEGIEELVEKMKRPYTEQADASLRDFDHAILQVLSAATLDDAQRIVNNLI